MTMGPMLPTFMWLLQITGAEFFISPWSSVTENTIYCILQKGFLNVSELLCVQAFMRWQRILVSINGINPVYGDFQYIVQ